MMNEKMTVAQKFDVVIGFLAELEDTAEMVAFLEDRKEKSIRKNSSSKSKEITDEQKAIRDEIVRVLTELAEDESLSLSEMQKRSELLDGCSTSKLSGNIRPLTVRDDNPNGIIIRTMVKKVAKFSLA